MSTSWKDKLGNPDLLRRRSSTGSRESRDVESLLTRVLLAAVVVGVFFCGLFPFDFLFRADIAAHISRRFDLSFGQFWTAEDMVENILFFVPAGFAIGAVIYHGRRKLWLSALMVMGASSLLSILVEMVQCFQPSRDASLVDLINNTIGSSVGFSSYALVAKQFVPRFARGFDRLLSRGGMTLLVVAATTLMIVASVTPYLLGKRDTSLASWNPRFAMAVGNEIGAVRWWRGSVGEFHLANRAISQDEVAAMFNGRAVAEVFGDAMQGSYQLRGEPPYVDASGKLPSLDRDPKLKHATTIPVEVVPHLSKDLSFQTRSPVEQASRAIASSNELTAIVTATSHAEDQYLVSRIVTISLGAFGRNFTIGQEGPNLVVRIRSGFSGDNGTTPQFPIKNVFADQNPHKIVVCFGGSRLRIYVDSVDNVFATTFSPEASLLWRLYPRPDWNFWPQTDNVAVHAAVYRGLVFITLGVLAGMIFRHIGDARQLTFRVVLMFIIWAVGVVMLESMSNLVGGQPLRFAALLASVLAFSVGVTLVVVNFRRRDEVIHASQFSAIR